MSFVMANIASPLNHVAGQLVLAVATRKRKAPLEAVCRFKMLAQTNSTRANPDLIWHGMRLMANRATS